MAASKGDAEFAARLAEKASMAHTPTAVHALLSTMAAHCRRRGGNFAEAAAAIEGLRERFRELERERDSA